MANDSLETLLELISNRTSINVSFKDLVGNKKGLNGIDINGQFKGFVKSCLLEVEAYLADKDVAALLNVEFKKLSYCTSSSGNAVKHFITSDSYNASPFIKLLHFRRLLIAALKEPLFKGTFFFVETGSWFGLMSSNDRGFEIVNFCPNSRGSEDIKKVEQDIKTEIESRLTASKNSPKPQYYALSISNGTFSEPYILKMSNGLIDELICSTAGHTSSALHSYLATFIKNNNSKCKTHNTLPLSHNGDCTRSSYYALIQFDYLTKQHGIDKAFSLLSKKNPYTADAVVFRDFQMLSYHCNFDPLTKKLYPLPTDMAAELGIKVPVQPLPEPMPEPARECPPDEDNIAPPRQQRSTESLNDFVLWLKKLEEKREQLHQRYPQDAANDMNTAYGAATQLVFVLNGYVRQYQHQNIDQAQFNQLASSQIQNNINGVLGTHRGIKEILINLLFAIGTLGVGYALAALFTQRFNPIQCNTDSVTILNEGESIATPG